MSPASAAHAALLTNYTSLCSSQKDLSSVLFPDWSILSLHQTLVMKGTDALAKKTRLEQGYYN